MKENLLHPRFWQIGVISLVVVVTICIQSMWLQRELSYEEKTQLLADASAAVARHNLEHGVLVNWTA